MNKMDEQILVVDREYLFDGEMLTFQGVLTGGLAFEHIMEKFNAYKEVRRGDAEENPAWKQPIPYVVLKRGDEVFVYKRLSGGGEARLHDQLSIGVGGHMNLIESKWDWESNFIQNLYRELHEELVVDLDIETRPKIIGLINDDENEVGRVHIGILTVLDLPEDAEVNVRETDNLEGYWMRIEDLLSTDIIEALETWSLFAAGVFDTSK